MAEMKRSAYPALKRRIQTLLHQGRKQIEAIRLETYWKIGHALRSEDSTTLRQLSQDLQMEQSLFYRTIQFSKAFPKRKQANTLTWSHYRELLSLPDPKVRQELAREAHLHRWDVRRLQRERRLRSAEPFEIISKQSSHQLTEPPQGNPAVYQVGWLKASGGLKIKAVDFGFEIYAKLNREESKRLKEGDLVSYSEKKRTWLPAGSPDDRYFYEATLEKVVDGDTLLVQLEFSENYLKRQYLRLRGINALPRNTADGKKATRFLETKLKNAKTLQFKSRRRDAYDRSVADVWAGGLYLNQALLDKGLAKRV